MTSPSLYQVISAAGLAPEALQVRLCGVWALRRTTGPPSTTGSEGGTVMQKQTYSSRQKDSLQLRASAEPQRRITDIELAVALSPSSIYNNTFSLPSVYLTRCSFRQEKRPRAVVIWWKKKKAHTHSNLFISFLGASIIALFALTVAEWCFNWIAYLFIYLHGFARTTVKPSVPPLMKASISPTNKGRRKHGVCAGLSCTLYRTNFTVCIWIVRGPSAAAARTLMESEC